MKNNSPQKTKEVKKKEKPIFPQKGKIILLLSNFGGEKDFVISGDGYIEGVKLTTGQYRFTGTLVKNYGK